MRGFNEDLFRQKIDQALVVVKTVLDNTKHPQQASAVDHSYSDKYLLSEFLTNTALAANLCCLEQLGLTDSKLKKLLKWSESRSVTLRLKAEENSTREELWCYESH